MLIVQVALAAAVCASATAKPNANIFFLLTDDQDVILGGLEPMAQVKKVCASVCVWGCSSYLHAFASESASVTIASSRKHDLWRSVWMRSAYVYTRQYTTPRR
jgi:hypothetical protein